MRKKIAIICPAELPVPSVKGGAVETLIDHFLDENEKRGWKVIPTSLILVDWRERIKRQVL